MLGKPRILSLFTNSFDKFNKILYFRLSYSLMVVIKISAGFLICQSADINSMRSNIQNYFSQSRYHGDNNAAYKLKARKFIYDEFSKYGLETLYQNFTGTQYPNVSHGRIQKEGGGRGPRPPLKITKMGFLSNTGILNNDKAT